MRNIHNLISRTLEYEASQSILNNLFLIVNFNNK